MFNVVSGSFEFERLFNTNEREKWFVTNRLQTAESYQSDYIASGNGRKRLYSVESTYWYFLTFYIKISGALCD